MFSTTGLVKILEIGFEEIKFCRNEVEFCLEEVKF